MALRRLLLCTLSTVTMLCEASCSVSVSSTGADAPGRGTKKLPFYSLWYAATAELAARQKCTSGTVVFQEGGSYNREQGVISNGTVPKFLTVSGNGGNMSSLMLELDLEAVHGLQSMTVESMQVAGVMSFNAAGAHSVMHPRKYSLT